MEIRTVLCFCFALRSLMNLVNSQAHFPATLGQVKQANPWMLALAIGLFALALLGMILERDAVLLGPSLPEFRSDDHGDF